MCRIVALLTLAFASVAFTVQPALAQSPAAGQNSPSLQQPDSQSPSPVQLAEDFDQDPITGWSYSCEHAVVMSDNGRALATRGGGHAVWEAAGQVTDFAMKVRYAYQQGVGDIFFRSTDTSQGMEFYFLMLQPKQVVLGRRLHTTNQKFPEKILARAPVSLSPQAWNEVIIQAKGGQIAVWINGQGALQVQDPKPLRSGMVGIGVIANSGHVMYDQVALVREGSGSASGANTANSP